MTHPETHEGHGHGEFDVAAHVRTYLIVFASLMVLTVITVALYYLHLPPFFAVGLALLVASVKGSLVACYFMHLISEKKLILVTMFLTLLAFFAVLLGPTITESNPVVY
jgi:cytochrome c oxidase subunit IV